MIKGLEGILLFSAKPGRLARFYADKVGLKITLEAETGEKGEEMYGFEFESGSNLYILNHSRITGKNKNPERMMFNLEVSDIESSVKKLERGGVKKIADTYHLQDYSYIATFEDIDGNYFQLVQTRPS